MSSSIAASLKKETRYCCWYLKAGGFPTCTLFSLRFKSYLRRAYRMKKEEIPQDNGALNKLTREVCYVVDEKGNYTTALSSGWEVKATALDATWKDIDQRILAVKKEVLEGRSSPIRYFMELRLMDPEILSAYTGF